jgi:hypothetical protein
MEKWGRDVKVFSVFGARVILDSGGRRDTLNLHER